jgi:hypothetical protein
VYLFVRNDSAWTQQAYIKASNTDCGHHFGSAVALEADVLVVGAVGERSGATGVGGEQTNQDEPDSGAVYLFSRSGGAWSQHAYVKASNTERIDVFGRSVALSGDALVVGAPLEDSAGTGVDADQADNGAERAGAAYLFQ